MKFVVYRQSDGEILMLGSDPAPDFAKLQERPEEGILSSEVPDDLFGPDEAVDVNLIGMSGDRVVRRGI